MARRKMWRTAVALTLLASCACDSPSPRETPAAGSRPAPAPSAKQAKAPPKPEPEPEPTPVPATPTLPAETCRAIRVQGRVTTQDDRPIQTGSPLDEQHWLVVDEQATLAVKHAETAREVRFDGPARVLPCFREDEQFLVARGTISTTAGVGARPGAEVLIATPFGVVGYGDATLRATVTDSTLLLDVRQGVAWIEGTTEEPAPERVAAGKQAKRDAKSQSVEDLLTRCEKSAAASEGRARDVLDPTADKKTHGKRAAAHLRARQLARKTCGIAAAALGQTPPPKNYKKLAGKLARSESRWQRVPSSQIPPKG